MQTTTLGRTNLTVSVAGLGCGGHSRLGLQTGGDEANAIRIIHAAMDAGVNFIDTAQVYGTEDVVGKAIAGRRDGLVLSTKVQIIKPGTKPTGGELISGETFITHFEKSLKRLGTDCVDIVHLHGVIASQYAHCVDELLPALTVLREAGKLRFFGLTERFIVDTSHTMLDRALEDNCWDILMVGFSLLNPSARATVFPRTTEKNIGILNMFAVRRALSNPAALSELIDAMVKDGAIDAAKVDAQNPLGFLTDDATSGGAAASVIEAAYRFCRHEPGCGVILTGTGNEDHLHENLSNIQKPALPDAVLARLADIFGEVDSVSGE